MDECTWERHWLYLFKSAELWKFVTCESSQPKTKWAPRLIAHFCYSADREEVWCQQLAIQIHYNKWVQIYHNDFLVCDFNWSSLFSHNYLNLVVKSNRASFHCKIFWHWSFSKSWEKKPCIGVTDIQLFPQQKAKLLMNNQATFLKFPWMKGTGGSEGGLEWNKKLQNNTGAPMKTEQEAAGPSSHHWPTAQSVNH